MYLYLHCKSCARSIAWIACLLVGMWKWWGCRKIKGFVRWCVCVKNYIKKETWLAYLTVEYTFIVLIKFSSGSKINGKNTHWRPQLTKYNRWINVDIIGLLSIHNTLGWAYHMLRSILPLCLLGRTMQFIAYVWVCTIITQPLSTAATRTTEAATNRTESESRIQIARRSAFILFIFGLVFGLLNMICCAISIHKAVK